jgi:hypothetical protein
MQNEHHLRLVFGEVIYNLDFGTYKIDQLKNELCAMLLNNLNHVGLLQG